MTNHPRRRRRQRERYFVTVVDGTLVAHLAQPDAGGVMRAVCPTGRDMELDLRPPPAATDLGPPELAWCGDCRAYFDYLRGQLAVEQLNRMTQSNGRRR